MDNDALTLKEVNDAIEQRSSAFPARIERHYADHLRNYRKKFAWVVLPSTLLAYNFYLIVDYVLLPGTFWIAAAVHFLIVSPLIVVATIVSASARTSAIRDGAGGLIACAMVAQIMFIYILNDGAAAEHYQYLAIMTPVFMNINLKLEHRNTVIATMAIGAIYLAGILYQHSSANVLLIGPMLFFAAAHLTLSAHKRMERDARHSFLRGLQDKLRREEAEIEACRDPLTGLFNRRRLDQRIAELRDAPDDSPSIVSIIVFDIDHFKAFNDRYGHLVGDLCLKKIGETVAASVRSEGELAIRFGGEEFVIMLEQTDLCDAIRYAERLRRAIEDESIPHEDSSSADVVTASFGVMSGPLSRFALKDLIQGADQALYAAKRAGRNRIWPPLVQASSDAVVELRKFRSTR